MKQEVLEKSSSEEIKSFVKTKTEKAEGDNLKPAIVESGPVQFDNVVEELDNDTEYDEEEAEDEHVSASQLLGFGTTDDGEYKYLIPVLYK